MNKIFFLCLLFSGVTFSQSPVPDNAELELIADGFQFVEGPVWNDSIGLLFSDLRGNRIYNWTEEDSISIFLNPSANSNGLTYDLEGELIVAQTGLRRVARRESDGSFTSLADTFNNKKLNSPNDLAVKSDGSIFFTDPPFNIPQGENQELTFAGIYRINLAGDLTLLDSTLNLPNGICFSTDETKLYVNNSQARIIYVWDVVDDSTISNKREFARINPVGYADGMKIDKNGNLFCTGPKGVWIFSPEGILLDTILVPINPSNCNWGGEDGSTLFITAGTSVFRIRLKEATNINDEGYLPKEIELYQNYPNPFNSSTQISFAIPDNEFVNLSLYNLIGEKIAELVNDNLSAGKYNIRFSTQSGSAYAGGSTNLPSGIYYYQLKAGNFSETKKIVLLK